MRIAKMTAKHFQYLVVGGGSGGIAGARRAAEFGAQVGLVEDKSLGGTCVNLGCVPKKIMFYASEYASKLHNFKGYGFDVQKNGFDWAKLKESRDAYITRLNQIYLTNLTKSNVQLIKGLAKFSEDQGGDGGVVRVVVGGEVYTADHMLIATGGRPVSLDEIPGHELGVSSDGFFEMDFLPKRVVLVGAGYIAVELAGILKSLGSEVLLVIRKDKVLRNFDSMISDVTTQNLEDSGVKIHRQSQVQKVELQNNSNNNTANNPSSTNNILKVHLDNNTILEDVDKLIWAVGRVANTDLGLNHVGVKLDKRGSIMVDEYQNTSNNHIYAVGDVCGKHLLTPVAIAAARRLSHRLFNNESNNKLDHNNIPSVIFSHPPSGSVGLSQAEAEILHGATNIKAYTSTFTPLHDSMLEHKSMCHYKLICLLPQEKVIGLHIVGDSSDEILQGFSVAIKMGATKEDFDNTIAIHPTSAEELVTLK